MKGVMSWFFSLVIFNYNTCLFVLYLPLYTLLSCLHVCYVCDSHHPLHAMPHRIVFLHPIGCIKSVDVIAECFQF